MYRSSLFLTAALVGTTIALVQPVASAKSASEVQSIARAVTVEINFKLKAADGRIEDIKGSGVIVHRKGDLYTLVTNRHVVCGRGQCSQLPPVENYNLSLADSQRYQVKKSSVKFLGNDLDLAIIQFRSNRNYSVAKVSTPDSLKAKNNVYTAGFPTKQPLFTFGEGEAIAVVNKRLIGDSGGYTIIHTAFTSPGMSGGGVFNSSGQLVAIHGQGDRFGENTEVASEGTAEVEVGSKIGVNRGIPVRWLVQNLAELGINLGIGSSVSDIRVARYQVPSNADEYFIAGFNKFVEPGNNVLSGKRLAIQLFTKAIQLNSKYEYAYFMRAMTYEQIKEFQKSLSDYDKAILLDSQNFSAYYNRANLKAGKLGDVPGAIVDYNQAIIINPRFSEAYNNRAVLKAERLNDVQGAITDYDQAIIINPKYSEAYNNRAVLKAERLNDVPGAMADYDQAIIINPKYSEAYNNRANLKAEKLNDVPGAMADYDQAIIINPKFSKPYYNRALLKAGKLNDLPGAMADYDQAIIINPKFSKAYYNRALLKDNLNNLQGAMADYGQAIIINPKYSIAYYNRGVLKVVKLNDRAGAIQDFRQAAKLFREQGNTQGLQNALNALRQLGATE
jgi:tetratricopeptide (TPR) repeat protein/S1-C subfamily serine protease